MQGCVHRRVVIDALAGSFSASDRVFVLFRREWDFGFCFVVTYYVSCLQMTSVEVEHVVP